jgi:hypothetical protein
LKVGGTYPAGAILSYMELTREQAEILERLYGQGFEIVAFPLYASYVGARKGECAALLAPVPSGGFTVFGPPTCMVSGNLGAKVSQHDGDYFVWKNERVAATPERNAELARFSAELTSALSPVA